MRSRITRSYWPLEASSTPCAASQALSARYPSFSSARLTKPLICGSSSMSRILAGVPPRDSGRGPAGGDPRCRWPSRAAVIAPLSSHAAACGQIQAGRAAGGASPAGAPCLWPWLGFYTRTTHEVKTKERKRRLTSHIGRTPGRPAAHPGARARLPGGAPPGHAHGRPPGGAARRPRIGAVPSLRGTFPEPGACMSESSGRTALITGANTGIGLATAIGLAAGGHRLYLACRSLAKGEAAAAAVRARTGAAAVIPVALDLADLASVARCARDFLDRDEPLHVLINNAGVAGRRGLTRDGFELQFGVNHLGHFALTAALLDRPVASDAHYSATGIDFDAVRRRTAHLTAMPEYSVSKLANVLFSQELARRTAGRGITTYALHPGVVASDIWRRVPWPVRPLITRRMLTTEQGAATSVYCATSPDLAGVTGR